MPKTVILLETSFKNQFFKQFASETLSKWLLRRFWAVLRLQWVSKKVPKGGSTNDGFRPKHCKLQVFWWFHNFLVVNKCFYNWHQKFNICVSKWTLWVVFGRYFASKEPSKVVILLSTSFKNHFFQHSASAAQSKRILEPFWTVLRPQIRSQGASQGGSPNNDFRLPEAFRPAQGPFGLWDPFPMPSWVFFNRFVLEFRPILV